MSLWSWRQHKAFKDAPAQTSICVTPFLKVLALSYFALSLCFIFLVHCSWNHLVTLVVNGAMEMELNTIIMVVSDGREKTHWRCRACLMGNFLPQFLHLKSFSSVQGLWCRLCRWAARISSLGKLLSHSRQGWSSFFITSSVEVKSRHLRGKYAHFAFAKSRFGTAN